MNYIQNKLV